MCLKKEIWIYASLTKDNKLDKGVLGLISKARKIIPNNNEWRICCTVLGETVDSIALELSEYVDKVYVFSDRSLKTIDSMVYADNIISLINKEKPEIILFSISNFNSLLAAAIGARMRTGVIAHSVDVRIDKNGSVVGAIPAFGGRYMGDITCPISRPQIVGVRTSDGYPEKLLKKGEIIFLSVSENNNLAKRTYKFLQECTPENEDTAIEDAEFIVCGGLGVGSKENWTLLEDTARLLGAEVACTRPPIDEGWVCTEKKMIGISGKYVAPRIYIGFGVSGSSHHMCGMCDSKLIININKDKNASSIYNSDFVIESDVIDILNTINSIL